MQGGTHRKQKKDRAKKRVRAWCEGTGKTPKSETKMYIRCSECGQRFLGKVSREVPPHKA